MAWLVESIIYEIDLDEVQRCRLEGRQSNIQQEIVKEEGENSIVVIQEVNSKHSSLQKHLTSLFGSFKEESCNLAGSVDYKKL